MKPKLGGATRNTWSHQKDSELPELRGAGALGENCLRSCTDAGSGVTALASAKDLRFSICRFYSLKTSAVSSKASKACSQ